MDVRPVKLRGAFAKDVGRWWRSDFSVAGPRTRGTAGRDQLESSPATQSVAGITRLDRAVGLGLLDRFESGSRSTGWLAIGFGRSGGR